MKKQLYGTTALVAAGLLAAVPGAQAAEPITVSIGGYMEQWFGWAENDDPLLGIRLNETELNSDAEIHFKGRTTLDNGLTVGVHIELEGQQSGDQIDEQYMILQGGFGQVLFGSENSAQYKMAYNAPDVGIGLSTGDVTNWVIPVEGTGDGRFRTPYGSMNVEAGGNNDSLRLTYFTPRIQGFQFGVSYAPDATQDGSGVGNLSTTLVNIFNVGANFNRTFNDVNIAVSFGWGTGENDNIAGTTGEDPEVFNVGANIGFAGFTLGGAYANQYSGPTTGVGGVTAGGTDFTSEGWDVGASYATGPWAFSVTYFHGEREGAIGIIDPDDDEWDAISGAASYSLGPGIKFVATLGYASHDAEDFLDSSGVEQDNNGVFLVGGFKVSF